MASSGKRKVQFFVSFASAAIRSRFLAGLRPQNRIVGFSSGSPGSQRTGEKAAF